MVEIGIAICHSKHTCIHSPIGTRKVPERKKCEKSTKFNPFFVEFFNFMHFLVLFAEVLPGALARGVIEQQFGFNFLNFANLLKNYFILKL